MEQRVAWEGGGPGWPSTGSVPWGTQAAGWTRGRWFPVCGCAVGARASGPKHPLWRLVQSRWCYIHAGSLGLSSWSAALSPNPSWARGPSVHPLSTAGRESLTHC